MIKDETRQMLNPEMLDWVEGSAYPDHLKSICDGRAKRRLGDALGLSQFGVNMMRLEPGAASSHRHWHEKEDEFVYVISGRVCLVTDNGEQELTAGMVAGFPAGRADGHHLVNRFDEAAIVLEVGTRSLSDQAHFPDVDMMAVKEDGKFHFLQKDGTPYNSES